MKDTHLVETFAFNKGNSFTRYTSVQRHCIQREFSGCSPNNIPFTGQWVLRAPDGSYIDHDTNRYNLFVKNGFSGIVLTIEQFLQQEFK